MANLIEMQKAKRASQAFGTLMSDYSQAPGDVENEAPEVEMMNEILEALSTAKRYHWATLNLGEHEALDFFYEGLEDLSDSLIEVYQGFKGSRLKGANEMEIPEYTLDASVEFLMSFKECVNGSFRMLAPERSVNNILDDISNLIGQTLYKLSLIK